MESRNREFLHQKIATLFTEATAYHQANQLESAALCYRKVLTSAPNHPDAKHLLGIILADQGKLEEGLKLITQAINHQSKFPPYYLNRGILYNRLKRYSAAIQDFNQALSLGAPNDHIFYQLGEAFFGNNQIDAAIDAYQKALLLNPQNFQAQHNLGNCYLAQGAYHEAIHSYQQTLTLKADLPETLSNLGVASYELKHFSEAIQYQQEALEVNPNYYQAYINLGLVYNRLADFDQAESAYRKALDMAPTSTEIHLNLGVNFKDQNRITEALECFSKALALKPIYPEAEFNQAISLLLAGNFTRGWQKYEARLKLKERQRDIDYPYPRWQGEELANKTLLVHAEQGLGDTLQLVRYLKLLPKTAVTLACQSELMSLLGKDYKVIPRTLPKEQFDYQIPIMSLPLIFQTTLENIPYIEGYIALPSIDEAPHLTPVLAALQQEQCYKVGMVWAGSTQHRNDHNRSLSLELLEPLFKIPTCKFYSLQCGERGLNGRPLAGLEDLSSHIKTFTDTALLLSQLDLLITVDTAIAHLSGAMNKSTWLLLPFAPDFRWLLDREDSPWYQSMQLFRQPNIGDWDTVMKRLVRCLEKLRRDAQTAA